MTYTQLQKFIEWLKNKDYTVIGPVKIPARPNPPAGGEGGNDQILIREIEEPKDLDLSGRLPFYSFKKYLLPSPELLFKYKNENLKEIKETQKQVIFGLSTFDLKALLLYNHIFEKDPYYQSRLQNTLIIGQVRMPPPNVRTFPIWQEKYEEDVLEHLQFDIFFGEQPANGKKIDFRVYTGSEKGQEIMDEFGYKNYEHIQFAGPIKEEGIEPRFAEIKNKMSEGFDAAFWEEISKKCIECGKCTIACPTCFCFDISDESDLEKNQGNRNRVWTSCFYEEFSEIAGGHKFLKTTAERIHNWYWHKFVRIFEEYHFPGCVGCGRCSMVCPANIDICEVLAKIEGKSGACKILR